MFVFMPREYHDEVDSGHPMTDRAECEDSRADFSCFLEDRCVLSITQNVFELIIVFTI